MYFEQFFENVSNKKKKVLENNTLEFGHLCDLNNILIENFTHDFEEKNDLPYGYIEFLLLNYGMLGICKDEKNNLVVGIANLMSTSYYNYQKGDKVNITMFMSNRVFEKTLGVDCEIIFNNTTRTPCIDLYTYSELFKDLDISLKVLIKKSRLINTPLARNEFERQQIQEMLNDIEIGNWKAIQSRLDKVEEFTENRKPLETIELTKAEATNYLQYLNLCKNSLKEFFFTKYGHSLRNTSKVAQQSKDEVNDLDITSQILIDNMYKNRVQGWERVNALFNTDFSCDFGELLKLERAKLNETVEADESNVETEEKTEVETEEEKEVETEVKTEEKEGK